MRTDYDHWEPISVSDAAGILLKSLLVGILPEVGLWIYIWGAGHGDIDILILREEQAAIYALAKEWTLYKADQGTLSLWEEGHSVGVYRMMNPFSFEDRSRTYR